MVQYSYVVIVNGNPCRDRGMVGECFGLVWGPVSVTGWIAVVICGLDALLRDRGCGDWLVRMRRVDAQCVAVVRVRPYGCDGKGDGPSANSSSELL